MFLSVNWTGVIIAIVAITAFLLASGCASPQAYGG